MAKKRLVVSPMDTSNSIVQPVARAVETYTRPAEERTQNQLATFMEGITPVIKQQAAQQQQQIAERNNAIKSGVIARQAQEARVATYDLLTTAGLEFEKNSEEYLEAGADALTADRQAFFDGHFQKMEEAGIDSEVIASVKRDVQYGNLKFFQEGFLPAKQTYENNKSLNILSKDLLITANATNLSPEAALAEVQKKTKDFISTHPTITWTQVNDLIRKTEATLASTLGVDGIPRGMTVLTDWLVENKQTTTKDDLTSFAAIQNAQVTRDTALAKKAKTSTDSIVSSITKPLINELKAEFSGREAEYSLNPKKLNEVANARIQKTVESVRETEGNDVANALERNLIEEWRLAYSSPDILGKIISADRNKVLSKNMDGILQVGIYDTDSPPEKAYATTEKLIKDIKNNSGLTESEVDQRLVDLVVQNAAEKGADNAINTYLVNKNIWQRDEFQDERKTLVAALKTFETKSSKKATLAMKTEAATKANEKVTKSGGTNVSDANRVTIVDPETGNTTVVSEEIVQSTYEQSQKVILDAELETITNDFDKAISQATVPADIESLQNQKEEALAAAVNAHADKKLKEYYLPRGQLPIEVAKQINNTSVYSVLKGQAGVPVSETRLEAVRRSLNLFQSMNDYQTGFGETAFKEPENAKRMKFLSILTRDGQMSLEDAIEQVQGPLYNVDQVQRVTTKELDDYQIDIFGPFDLNPFSDVSNKGDLKAYFNDNVSARMATLGEDRKTAFDKVAEEVLKDFHIVEYPNGVETAVLKRNTDQQTLGQDVGNKMLALTEQATKLQGMNEYITSIVPEGGGLVMRNNPSNGNMVTMYITDETGRIASPVASFSFDDLNNLPVEIMKERIARDAAEQLALTGSVTQEERDILTEASSIATGAFGVPMSVTETDVATFAKAKKEVAEKRAAKAAKAALPYEQTFPEEAPTAQQVVPFIVDTLSQYVDPVVASNIGSILQTSVPAIEAKIKQQRKKMSNRKAINAATKLLKSIDPALVDTLRFNVRGLEGRYATKRGITVTEQASNAHALLATVDVLKEQGITDFFPVR
jgi:hypothetical protein